MPTSRANLLAAWEKLQAGLEAHQDELQLVDVYREQLDAELAGLQACQSKRSELQAESLQATQDLKISFARAERPGDRPPSLAPVLLRPPQRHAAGLRNEAASANGGLQRGRPGKEEGTPWKPAEPCRKSADRKDRGRGGTRPRFFQGELGYGSAGRR